MKTLFLALTAFASLTARADQPDLLKILGIENATPFFESKMYKIQPTTHLTAVMKLILPAGTYTGHTSTPAKKCTVVVAAGNDFYQAQIFGGSEMKLMTSVVVDAKSLVTHHISAKGPTNQPVLGVLNTMAGKRKATFMGTWLEGAKQIPNTEIVVDAYSGDNEFYGFRTLHCQRLVRVK